MSNWQWASAIGSKGLDPFDLMNMRDAVNSNCNYFVTEDGRHFKLTYMPDGQRVRFNPEVGFAPMGFIRIADLLREDEDV
jgi:hypothetical protein